MKNVKLLLCTLTNNKNVFVINFLLDVCHFNVKSSEMRQIEANFAQSLRYVDMAKIDRTNVMVLWSKCDMVKINVSDEYYVIMT